MTICENGSGAAEQLCRWVEEYCVLYQLKAVIRCFVSPEAFRQDREDCDIAFLGFGGSEGFLMARALRDRDRRCRIILIDDTPQYAVQSVRIHCTDLIIRPVDFRKVVQSMHLACGGGPL